MHRRIGQLDLRRCESLRPVCRSVHRCRVGALGERQRGEMRGGHGEQRVAEADHVVGPDASAVGIDRVRVDGGAVGGAVITDPHHRSAHLDRRVHTGHPIVVEHDIAVAATPDGQFPPAQRHAAAGRRATDHPHRVARLLGTARLLGRAVTATCRDAEGEHRPGTQLRRPEPGAGLDRPAGTGPCRIGPSRIGPSRIGPSRIGPSRIGPCRIGSDPADACEFGLQLRERRRAAGQHRDVVVAARAAQGEVESHRASVWGGTDIPDRPAALLWTTRPVPRVVHRPEPDSAVVTVRRPSVAPVIT